MSQAENSEIKDPIQLALNNWNEQKTEENAKKLKTAFEETGVSKTKDMLKTLSSKEYKVSKTAIGKLLQTDAFRSKYDKKKKALKEPSQEQIPVMSS